ncbi:MAG: permease-like cell division protein FtsX [Clostridia bacterium]|nr:permease-like cell division protein FtsX [Clostridia bacterium]
MKNLGYFIKETAKIIRKNFISNLFSFIGTVLILFLLGFVISGWIISEKLVQMLRQEAEISAYFTEETDPDKQSELVNTVKDIEGVWNVKLVDTQEAHLKMEEILGEEAQILELFDHNPFEAFLEISIDLDRTDFVLDQVASLNGIDFIRDNREILEKMQGITQGIELLAYMIIAAVSITTLVIISNMIRQGIYQNKEHIYTLRLLGAPSRFIGFPFFLVGMLLSFGGGVIATVLTILLINRGYGQIGEMLPFIHLPPKEELCRVSLTVVMVISIILGISGSIMGLSSANKEKHT